MSEHLKYAFKFLILTLSIVRITCCMSGIKKLPEVNGDIFYYFTYGSNMLTKYMHILNPAAVKLGVGELKNYRLDFNTFSQCWDGARATIVPTSNATVFGTLWEINVNKLRSIDDQKHVPENIHYAESVPICLANGTEIIARTYMLVDQPKSELRSFYCKEVPTSRQPSKTYLQCLIKGAMETELPTHYVDWLRSVKHNGKVVSVLEWYLELQAVELTEESKLKVSCSELNHLIDVVKKFFRPLQISFLYKGYE